MKHRWSINLNKAAWRIGLAILGVGLALSGWGYQTEQQTLRTELTHNAEIVGFNLWQVTRQGMANNDHAHVRTIVASVVGRDAVVQARVLGLNGKVYADSGGELQGSSIMPSFPGCAVCHRYAELPKIAALPFQPNRLRIAVPIPNESTCNSCHNQPNKATLGVVLVDVDMTERVARARTLWALVAGGAVLGGLAVTWALRGFPRPTLRPIPRWRPRLAPGLFLGVLGLLGLLAGGGFTVVHLEENAAFCASCHTEPETTYVQRLQSAPTDLASAHSPEGVACIDCHSGAGVAGRVDALALGAQNVVRFVTGNYQRPTRQSTPIQADHCTKCHADTVSVLSARNHFHYYAQNWDQPNACVSCHPAHPTGRTQTARYMLESDLQPVCAQCHQNILNAVQASQ